MSKINRLAAVTVVALLVSGGIAAIYRGPIRPLRVDDANAALKAERARAHKLFDPADFVGEGDAALTDALVKVPLDMSYLRRGFFNGTSNGRALLELPARGRSLSDPPLISGGAVSTAAPVNRGTDPARSEVATEERGGSLVDLTHLLDLQFQIAGHIPAPNGIGWSAASLTGDSVATASLAFGNLGPGDQASSSADSVIIQAFTEISTSSLAPVLFVKGANVLTQLAQRELLAAAYSPDNRAAFARSGPVAVYGSLPIPAAEVLTSQEALVGQHDAPGLLIADTVLDRVFKLDRPIPAGPLAAPAAVPEPRTILLFALAFLASAYLRSIRF